MIRVFHLLDGTAPAAGGENLSLVIPRLDRAAFTQSVGTLGDGPPVGDEIPVREFRLRSGFGPSGWRTVRRVVGEFRPHILHTWGPGAARLGWLLTRRRVGLTPAPRLVVSAADRPEPGWRTALTRRAVRAADRVVAFGGAEAARYCALGLSADRLAVAPLGVAPPARASGDVRALLGIPTGTPYIVAAGGPGAKDAIWAFDVIRYADPAMRLVVFGDWPDKSNVERFAKAIGVGDYRVDFVGTPRTTDPILAEAAAVWVPMTSGGTRTALTALAAGTPVVGFRTPDLEAVLTDGETGILVPPGDRVALAGRTLELLDDPALRDRIVTAGRAAAADRFPPEPVAAAVAAVYHALSPQTP
jgi:glycosyltransferase involved in cell wall biosynthesis